MQILRIELGQSFNYFESKITVNDQIICITPLKQKVFKIIY